MDGSPRSGLLHRVLAIAAIGAMDDLSAQNGRPRQDDMERGEPKVKRERYSRPYTRDPYASAWQPKGMSEDEAAQAAQAIREDAAERKRYNFRRRLPKGHPDRIED